MFLIWIFEAAHLVSIAVILQLVFVGKRVFNATFCLNSPKIAIWNFAFFSVGHFWSKGEPAAAMGFTQVSLSQGFLPDCGTYSTVANWEHVYDFERSTNWLLSYVISRTCGIHILRKFGFFQGKISCTWKKLCFKKVDFIHASSQAQNDRQFRKWKTSSRNILTIFHQK